MTPALFRRFFINVSMLPFMGEGKRITRKGVKNKQRDRRTITGRKAPNEYTNGRTDKQTDRLER